jgi:hypothetical protein
MSHPPLLPEELESRLDHNAGLQASCSTTSDMPRASSRVPLTRGRDRFAVLHVLAAETEGQQRQDARNHEQHAAIARRRADGANARDLPRRDSLAISRRNPTKGMLCLKVRRHGRIIDPHQATAARARQFTIVHVARRLLPKTPSAGAFNPMRDSERLIAETFGAAW